MRSWTGSIRKIVNSGDIYGNIITFGSDDSIENSGTLHLSYTGIYLGGSASAGTLVKSLRPW